MGLSIDAVQQGRFTILRIAGEIDLATVPQLRAAVETSLKRADPHLVLDLTDVSFCDSTGLGLLVATRRRLPAGAPPRLVGVQPLVARVFQVTGLSAVFPTFDTVSDAMAGSAEPAQS